MPIKTHIRLSILLVILTMMSIVYQAHYQHKNSIYSILDGQEWVINHRGYPSQFGYLNQLLDIRVIDIQIVASAHDDIIKNEMKFHLSNQDGPFGHFDINFTTKWTIDSNSRLAFEVLIDTIELSNISPELQPYANPSFASDLVVSMFRSPRQIISIAENELILEVPYMGIVRAQRR